MKKNIIFLLLIGVTLLTGCGKGKEYVTCESVVNNAINRCEDFPEYIKMDRTDSNWEQNFEVLYGEYADNVRDFYFIHSSDNVRDEEIVVIRFDTNENALGILPAMEKRKEERIEDIKSYAPDDVVQMVKKQQ